MGNMPCKPVASMEYLAVIGFTPGSAGIDRSTADLSGYKCGMELGVVEEGFFY